MQIRYNGQPISQVDQRFSKKLVVKGSDPRLGNKPVSKTRINPVDIFKAIYVLALIGVGILSVYNAL